MTPEEKQYSDVFKGYKEYKRRRALRACFERSSYDYSLTDYNRFIRCWLWLKTLICIILNRTDGTYLNVNSVCVLSYDWSSYEYQTWKAVWIDSSKLLTGWQVCIGSDGT